MKETGEKVVLEKSVLHIMRICVQLQTLHVMALYCCTKMLLQFLNIVIIKIYTYQLEKTDIATVLIVSYFNTIKATQTSILNQ